MILLLPIWIYPSYFFNLPRLTGHQIKRYNQIKGGSKDMEGIRRQYSEGFKKEAVGHSLTSEKTVVEVARDLGIAHSNLIV